MPQLQLFSITSNEGNLDDLRKNELKKKDEFGIIIFNFLKKNMTNPENTSLIRDFNVNVLSQEFEKEKLA